jgi:hypothetical protein
MSKKSQVRRALWWAAHDRRTPPALRDDETFMEAFWAFHLAEVERHERRRVGRPLSDIRTLALESGDLYIETFYP